MVQVSYHGLGLGSLVEEKGKRLAKCKKRKPAGGPHSPVCLLPIDSRYLTTQTERLFTDKSYHSNIMTSFNLLLAVVFLEIVYGSLDVP